MRGVVALLLFGSSATAQVSVRGIAYDSLQGRPLAGAFIGIAGTPLTAISDSLGRFAFNGVAPGVHRFVMQHDVLDAIGLTAAGRQVTITDGRVLVTVAVPSFATLWKAACSATPPARDTGFVFGSVSRQGKSVRGAIVRARWIEVVGDSAAAVRARQRTIEVDADSSGNYTLCGVPRTATISVRASTPDADGGWLEIPALSAAGLTRRDIALAVSEPVATPAVAATAVEAVTVTFTGRLRVDGDEPLADADVLIPGLNLSATTNDRGEFRIRGVTPGSHTVHVRKIGYSFKEQQVQFAAEPVDRTLVGARITLLDSLVRTERPYRDPNMEEFEERRRIGRGRFFTRADLAKREGGLLGSFIQQTPGLLVHAAPDGDYVIAKGKTCHERVPPITRSRGGGRGGALCSVFYLPPNEDRQRGVPVGCYARVYLDNQLMNPGTPAPPFNLRETPPTMVEAMEVYARSSEVPWKYHHLNSGCGVVLIHTRRPK